MRPHLIQAEIKKFSEQRLSIISEIYEERKAI
jgi:hypothetical protein